MLIVVDNVLAEDARKVVVEYFSQSDTVRDSQWADAGWDVDSPMAQIVANVSKFFDLSKMVGCEYWAHYGTRPEWHVDKDEELMRRAGELAMPLCSIVYYADVQNLVGGQFMTKTEMVTPVTNRILAFSPGVFHGVADYSGTRLSVAVNPWAQKPEGYK
jgi:hypothetical protein